MSVWKRKKRITKESWSIPGWVFFDTVCVCRLKERTYSLWAHLLSEQQNYLNPLYSPSFAESHPVLEPSTQPWNFKYASCVIITEIDMT